MIRSFASLTLGMGLALLLFGSSPAIQAQELSLFFPSSALDETVDQYGNRYSTAPKEAVLPFPSNFGGLEGLVIEGVLADPNQIYKTFTDAEGNTYTTTAADASLEPSAVYTATANTTDNLWQLRAGALPNMGVLESRSPAGTEDAPQLKTTVTMAKAGTYNVYLWYGDIGSLTDDLTDPTPLEAAIEGNPLQTYFQADGLLVTDQYGFNILEVPLGTVTVEANDPISVLIDDHVGEGARSAYLGIRVSEDGPTTPPAPITFDFNTDNKWMLYPVTGRVLILSHGPGSGEDAPPLTTTITVAHAGTYEMIFHFMDSNETPDEGWIKVALNDNPAEDYGAGHPDAVRASGGTSPVYPWIDGRTYSGMFWYTASMGEVTVAAGEDITITIDDFQWTGSVEYMATVFEGITLRVIEGGPAVSEIMVSPAYRFEWGQDKQGNRYRTVGADASLTMEQVFSTGRSGSDNLWEVRTPKMGPYGDLYSGFGPGGTEDCPALKTEIEVISGGTYRVILYMGDVAQVGTDDLESPCLIKAGFDLQNLTTYFQADGEFIGLYGFNILEVEIGQVTVEDGGLITVYIDDADPVEGNDRRSNYAGLLLEKVTDPGVANWALF